MKRAEIEMRAGRGVFLDEAPDVPEIHFRPKAICLGLFRKKSREHPGTHPRCRERRFSKNRQNTIKTDIHIGLLRVLQLNELQS